MKLYVIHKSNRKRLITIKSSNQIKVVDYDLARPDEGHPTDRDPQKDKEHP